MVKKSTEKLIPIATLMVMGGALWLWAFINLMHTGILDALAEINITGNYYPGALIVLVLGILLLMGGKKAKDFIK